jgi:hypothetical protein
MRLFARADGAITVAERSIEVGATPRVLPGFVGAVAETLDFDDETNGDLADALESSTAPFRLSGGVLTRDGLAVTIAAPGRFVQDREQIQQALGVLDTLIDASNAGSLSAAQSQQALRLLLRVARYVLKWIARRG